MDKLLFFENSPSIPPSVRDEGEKLFEALRSGRGQAAEIWRAQSNERNN
jgi:hypothetical protein